MSEVSDVHLRLLRPLAALLVARHVDPNALFGRHGIRLGELLQPHARTSYTKLCAVWQDAVASTGDADLGLHVAEMVAAYLPGLGREGEEYLAAQLLKAAPTVGEGVTWATRAQRIACPQVGYTARADRAGAVRIALTPLGGPPAPRAVHDFFVAWPVTPLWALTGAPLVPESASFAYPLPARTETHRRLFGPRVAFGAAETGFGLGHAAWHTPLLTSDPPLFAALRQSAAEQLAEEVDIVARLRALLRDSWVAPPSAEAAAKALGVSPRTMARHLSAAGTSFRDLSDELRQARARVLIVDEGRGPAEAAPLLGYSDERALRRAIRRWQREGAWPR